MPPTYDIDKIKKRKLCFTCIGEAFLKDQVSKQGKCGECSYCNEKLECFSIEKLSKLIEIAFETHYYRTSDQPTAYDYAMMKEFNKTGTVRAKQLSMQ
ncbi:MAG: hypothetical protein NPIRA01_33340 [Nitrospirales bacterium]|nr:MAG: hypothetical protein NPIRA01_33340 [Nitrospirales bacterium]